MAKRSWQKSPRRSARWPAALGKRQDTGGPQEAQRWQASPAAARSRTAARRWALAVAITLLLCGLLATGALSVLSWFQPTHPPILVVISSRLGSSSPLGAVNPFALRDAEALCQREQTFDTSQANAQSLTTREMRVLIDGLPDSSGRNVLPWLSWLPTTEIVYVNAPGIALANQDGTTLVPYLVPDDVSGRVVDSAAFRRQLVPVNDLLRKFSQTPVEHRVLVLDCQQLDHLWPGGVLSNPFVEAVQSLLQRNKPDGMTVLFSCSPGQISWNREGHRRSVFNEFFLKGVEGQADDDRDNRVTLDELSRFLRDGVSQSVLTDRNDVQQPFLQTFRGDMEISSQIVVAHRSRDAAEPTQNGEAPQKEGAPGDDESPSQRLQEEWFEYYGALGSQSPYQSTPVRWRAYEALLLKAEQAYRAGDLDTMQRELATAPSLRNDIQQSPLSPGGAAAYSLPMLELVGTLTAASEDDSPPNDETNAKPPAAEPNGEPAPDGKKSDENSQTAKNPDETKSNDNAAGTEAGSSPKNSSPKTPKKKAPQGPLSAPEVARLVQQMINGNRAVKDVGEELQKRGSTLGRLPAEAELAWMMAVHWPESGDQTEQTGLSATARTAVASRVQIEELAVPQGRLAPQVFPWIRRRVEQADRAQRLGEDAFFLANGKPVGLGDAPAGNGASTGDGERLSAKMFRELIAQTSQAATTIGRAVGLREQLLSELPYLARLLSVRPWAIGENSLIAEIDPQVRGLLDDVRQMSVALDRDAPALDQEALDGQVADVNALTSQAEERRGKVMAAIGREMRKLATVEGRTMSSDDWRRIDAVLRIPFAYSAEPSKTLAARRMALLAKLTGTRKARSGRSETPAAADRIRRIADQQSVALGFYSTAIPGLDRTGEAGGESLSGIRRNVADAWSQAYQTATRSYFAADDRNGLFQADAASRILAAQTLQQAWRASRQSPVILQQRRRNTQFLCWHARRRAEDFWSGRKLASPEYFAKTAADYLRDADTVSPGDQPCQKKVRTRLDTLNRIAASFRNPAVSGLLKTEPPDPSFRGTDVESVNVVVEAPQTTPYGVARIEFGPGTKQLAVQSAGQLSSPAAFQLTRKTADGFAETLSATLFYRGRLAALPVPVTAASDVAGATITYRNDLPPTAQIVLRAQSLDTDAGQVLFVLDCSRSMDGYATKAGTASRMEVLKRTLNEFARLTESSGLQVGIRVFGDQVVWKPGDAQQEAQARKDTRRLLALQSFNRQAFQNVVSSLRPKGESPLFQALLKARKEDFPETSKQPVIIVVSDGADNWALVGQKPGVAEIRQAYRESSIRIDTIGFQTDDAGFAQLQGIAGATGGKALRAEQSGELLDCLLNIAQIPKYRILRQPSGEPATEQSSGSLSSKDPPNDVPPGTYEIQVLDRDDTVLGQLANVPVSRGQRHSIEYQNGELTYQKHDITADVALLEDPSTAVQLQVRQADVGTVGLELTLALAKPEEPNWQPVNPRFRIIRRELGPWSDNNDCCLDVRNLIYTFQGLPPNVPGDHVPVWNFRLEDWPPQLAFAEIEAYWSDASAGTPSTHRLVWDQDDLTTVPALPSGIRVTRRSFQKQTQNGNGGNVVSVTLVFPAGYRGNIQDWSVRLNQLDHPVTGSTQIYNGPDRLYHAHFQLKSDKPPQSVSIVGPGQVKPQPALKGTVDLRLKDIN